jgi:hypothetical protein
MSLLQAVLGPEYYHDGMINRDVVYRLPDGCPQGARFIFTQILNGLGICVNIG